MNKKIIVEKNALTVQVAFMKEDELIRFHISSLFEPDLQNKIVIGQVMQVVKNLKAAFVDYGNEKNGMLHFKQVPDAYLNKLQPGVRLPVQIVKQNIGEKGHKLTAKVNLSGRYLICLPFEPGINISKKITDQLLRQRLKEYLGAQDYAKRYGFIVRTHAEKVPFEVLMEDARQLVEKADQLMQTKDYLSKGTVLYEELSAGCQMIVDTLMGEEDVEIVCNDKLYLEELYQMARAYACHEKTKFTLYEGMLSIWAAFSLGKKIDEMLKRRVWLKSGGNLMIDYTEAMTVIDVNSAKAVVTKSPDKAALNLNKEAVKEAILQMNRRNLSGMIIVDLVEMKSSEAKKEIYNEAKRLLEYYEDSRSKVYPLTELGLLQFSRTKKYQCLPHQLLTSCTGCGAGYGKKSFLYEMMKLEEKLKQVKLTDEKQTVYLEVCPEYAEQATLKESLSRLEAYYPVNFNVLKSKITNDKNILCQFYAK